MIPRKWEEMMAFAERAYQRRELAEELAALEAAELRIVDDACGSEVSPEAEQQRQARLRLVRCQIRERREQL